MPAASWAVSANVHEAFSKTQTAKPIPLNLLRVSETSCHPQVVIMVIDKTQQFVDAI